MLPYFVSQSATQKMSLLLVSTTLYPILYTYKSCRELFTNNPCVRMLQVLNFHKALAYLICKRLLLYTSAQHLKAQKSFNVFVLLEHLRSRANG